jgi:hypothetical protein
VAIDNAQSIVEQRCEVLSPCCQPELTDPCSFAEELHSKIAAQQDEEREKIERRQANVQGLVKITTSVDALSRVVSGEQSLTDGAGITVAHSMEIPVGERDSLKLGGSVFSEDGAGLAAFMVG